MIKNLILNLEYIFRVIKYPKEIVYKKKFEI